MPDLPDYYSIVVPGRTRLVTGQSEWGVSGNEYIEGGDVVDVDLYTVPEGYEVQVACIVVSCTKAGIHFSNLMKDLADVGSWNYNILSVLPLMGGAEFVFEEGELMTLEMTNEIEEGASFYYLLKGTINEV